jgi:hypothetical protein
MGPLVFLAALWRIALETFFWGPFAFACLHKLSFICVTKLPSDCRWFFAEEWLQQEAYRRRFVITCLNLLDSSDTSIIS